MQLIAKFFTTQTQHNAKTSNFLQRYTAFIFNILITQTKKLKRNYKKIFKKFLRY